jgi:hypothetical protein
MLNELYQVVTALEGKGVSFTLPHPSLEPMKNAPLLVVRLVAGGKPTKLEMLKGEDAERIFRIKHASSGSSFPGLNIPLPLCDLTDAASAESESSPPLAAMIRSLSKKSSSAGAIGDGARTLYPLSKPTQFKQRQQDDFNKSVSELVGWLREAFREAPDGLRNLKLLLDLVAEAAVTLPLFAPMLAERIVSSLADIERPYCPLLVDLLFGSLDWKGRTEPPGSQQYFKKKTALDTTADGGPRKQFIYLELAEEDVRCHRVSDWRVWKAVNQHFIATRPLPFKAKARASKKAEAETSPGPRQRQGRDAFTGAVCTLADSFQGSKLAKLPSSFLFSNNTDDAGCFFRYGLGKADTFKVGQDVFLRISGALSHLAGYDKKDREGKTWMSIPAPQAKKACLLVAYLEEEPDEVDEYAALFGTHDESVLEADYEAKTSQVLAALKGKVAANPDLRIRLLAIASIDKANNQLVLNRSLFARDVVKAAEEWRLGVHNCPEVTMTFPASKESRQTTGRTAERKARASPAPLDICSVINNVWSSKSDGGFDVRYQRAISVADAYDVFLGPDVFCEPKTRFALHALLIRMRIVFARTGLLNATGNLELLNVHGRGQVLKAVALIGILLRQLNQHHETFMKDTIYQVGRLLALADSLHFQYCKWVRTSDKKRQQGQVDAPTELLGNSLFNFALDEPVMAVARLAERIRPYKGWADSYTGPDAERIQELIHKMGECAAQIDLDTAKLPPRMEDIHKAQLLLGYLADSRWTKNQNPQNK